MLFLYSGHRKRRENYISNKKHLYKHCNWNSYNSVALYKKWSINFKKEF